MIENLHQVVMIISILMASLHLEEARYIIWHGVRCERGSQHSWLFPKSDYGLETPINDNGCNSNW
ncbi:unnamed protein product, partial [Vitis vinifera]|uniref:Uncharacterized protein n=1 Tax=Vitis vinifera TaxID=29760 RepID=D7T045_VITVI